MKERYRKDFGIPTQGFFIGFFGVEKQDMFVELDGQSYKVVCIDKPRIRLPTQNEIQQNAERASDAPNETSETEHTPAQQQTLSVIPKQTINDSEMETDFFNVAPSQQLFTFWNVQKDDPLALTKHE